MIFARVGKEEDVLMPGKVIHEDAGCANRCLLAIEDVTEKK